MSAPLPGRRRGQRRAARSAVLRRSEVQYQSRSSGLLQHHRSVASRRERGELGRERARRPGEPGRVQALQQERPAVDRQALARLEELAQPARVGLPVLRQHRVGERARARLRPPAPAPPRPVDRLGEARFEVARAALNTSGGTRPPSLATRRPHKA